MMFRRHPTPPAAPASAPDDRLTITFEDEAHEAFQDVLLGMVLAGQVVRINGTAVRFTGYASGELAFYVYNEDTGDDIGTERHMDLRDDSGLLTITSVEVY